MVRIFLSLSLPVFVNPGTLSKYGIPVVTFFYNLLFSQGTVLYFRSFFASVFVVIKHMNTRTLYCSKIQSQE